MRPRSAALLLGAAALLPHLIKVTFYPSYPGFDDAFIHLRVAENFALGRGWGLNPGEPINVSSSPLYTALLALATRLFPSALAFGMLASGVATSLSVVLLHRLALAGTRHPTPALVPPVLFASNVHLWRWNGTVMEATIACLLLGLALASFGWALKGAPARAAAYGLAVGAAFLTRFELGLLLPAAALALVLSRQHGFTFGTVTRLAWAGAGFMVIAAAWLAFAWSQFGTPLPTTFLAKASSYAFPHLATTRSIVLVLGSSFAVPGMLAAGLSLTPAASPARRDRVAVPPAFVVAALFALLCVAYYAVAVAEFQSAARYLLPAVYAISLPIGSGLANASGSMRPMFALAGAAHLVIMLVINQVAITPVLAAFEANYWRASREAARYLAGAARPGDTVFALSDIGMLAYYSDDKYRVVDGPGLSVPGLVGRSPLEILAGAKPRFFVEHYGDASNESIEPAPGLHFDRVKDVRFAAAGIVASKPSYSLNIYERRGPPQDRRSATPASHTSR